MSPRTEARLGIALAAIATIAAGTAAVLLAGSPRANHPLLLAAFAAGAAAWILIADAQRREAHELETAARANRRRRDTGGRIVTGGSTATIHRHEERTR